MKKGFIALVTILTASAVALLVSSTILLRSITEASLSQDEEFSNQARAAVNACVETALINLSLASTTGIADGGWDYVGGEPVEVGDNTCYILPVTGTGTSSPRTVTASSTVRDFTKKIRVVVATNTPAVSVSSWTEVADF